MGNLYRRAVWNGMFGQNIAMARSGSVTILQQQLKLPEILTQTK